MTAKSPIGILALQGDFAAHSRALRTLGVQTCFVRKASELEDISALVLPGGESSAMLKLMDPELKRQLCRRITAGLPTLATCAGIILLAKHVAHPEQESLSLLDVDVERNAYGRQVDSFVDHEMQWTEEGKRLYKQQGQGPAPEGVFIRAPRITRCGMQAKCILESRGHPVMVVQDNIFALTFHPEMSESGRFCYEMWITSSQSRTPGPRA